LQHEDNPQARGNADAADYDDGYVFFTQSARGNVDAADYDDGYAFFATPDFYFTQGAQRSKARKGVSLCEIGTMPLLHVPHEGGTATPSSQFLLIVDGCSARREVADQFPIPANKLLAISSPSPEFLIPFPTPSSLKR
jgi:hypothetical protein